MKKFYLILFALLLIGFVNAQETTKNNFSSKYGNNGVDLNPEFVSKNVVSTEEYSDVVKHRNTKTIQRRVLHEVFTSSTCGYCPPANSNIDDIVLSPSNYDDCTLIKYQVHWPGAGDPYQTSMAAARVNYYGVSGVPAFFVDANDDVGGTSYSQSHLNSHLEEPAYFSIEGEHTIVGNQVEVEVTIVPEIDFIGICHVVVVEKETTGNVGSNGETEFHYVAMAMLPSSSGTAVNLTAGEEYSYTVSKDMSSTFVEEMYDLEVVMFLQAVSTKEVMQSNYSVLNNVGSDLIVTETNVVADITNCVYSDVSEITVDLYNYGVNDITEFDIFYIIDEGVPVEENVVHIIPAGETYTYTFETLADLSELGIHNIDVEVSYTDDVFIENNTASTVVISGDDLITIYIDFDNYPAETSWDLVDQISGETVAEGSGYTSSVPITVDVCALSDVCYTFTIYDAYGDGICCSYGSGEYSVTRGGEELASGGSFGSSQSRNIGVVLDVELEDIFVCPGEEITFLPAGIGEYDTEASIIDNNTPATTTVNYIIAEGNVCELNESFDVTVYSDVLDIASDDIEICAGEEIIYPDGYGVFTPATISNTDVGITNVDYLQNGGSTCELSTSFDVIVNNNDIDIELEDIVICPGEVIEYISGGVGSFDIDAISIDNITPDTTVVSYTVAAGSLQCEVTEEFNVIVVDANIDIILEDITICAGEEIFFPEGLGTFDPASVSNAEVGVTTVTYTVNSGMSCELSEIFDVTVKSTELDVVLEDIVLCPGDIVEYIDGATGDFDIEASAIDNITPDTTLVTYTLPEGALQCEEIGSFNVIIIDPSMDIIVDDIAVCLGETFTFPEGEGVYNPTTVSDTEVGTTTVTYTINTGMSCESSVSFDVFVKEVELDVVLEDIILCPDETVEYVVGATGNFDIEASAIDNVTPDTTLVIYTLPDGPLQCEASGTFNVIIVDATMDINSEDIHVCLGEEINLPEGSGTFTPNTVSNSEEGITAVSYTLNEGMSCEETVSFDVNVHAIPVAEITLGSGFELSTTSTENVQWYFADEEIVGETGLTYVCVEDGSYYAIISTEYCSNQSNIIDVSGTFVEFAKFVGLNVYPNPANDKLFIEFDNYLKLFVKVMDCTGKVIVNQNVVSGEFIDVSHLVSGVYFVDIKNKKNEGGVYKIIIE